MVNHWESGLLHSLEIGQFGSINWFMIYIISQGRPKCSVVMGPVSDLWTLPRDSDGTAFSVLWWGYCCHRYSDWNSKGKQGRSVLLSEIFAWTDVAALQCPEKKYMPDKRPWSVQYVSMRLRKNRISWKFSCRRAGRNEELPENGIKPRFLRKTYSFVLPCTQRSILMCTFELVC